MDEIQIPDPLQWAALNINILTADLREYGKQWGGNVRIRNDFDRLYLLKEGTAYVRDDNGEMVTLLPGHLYLFPGGTRGRYYSCRDTMLLAWLHFRVEIFPGISIFSHYLPEVQQTIDDTNADRFSALIRDQKENTPQTIMAAVGTLASLIQPFMPVSWHTLFPSLNDATRLQPVLTMIQQELDQPFELKKLAKTVSLHPTYLSNVFKKTFGMTPSQYQKKLRMHKAKLMLQQVNSSIADTAYACGYNDPLYFSRAFHDYVGISPSTYKQDRTYLLP